MDFSKLGNAVIELMAGQNEWLGNSAELLDTIASDCSSETELQRAGWPKNPKALNSQMRRVAPTLESRGLKVVFGISDGNRKRLIRITSGTAPTVQPSRSPIAAAVRSDGPDGPAGRPGPDTTSPIGQMALTDSDGWTSLGAS